MLDPVVGGYTEQARKLRQAIAIAVDFEEYISIFLNGRGIPAQSPIPPGIFGFVEGDAGVDTEVYDLTPDGPRRKPIEVARRLLADAGYPEGRDIKTGKPLVLYLDTDLVREQAEAAKAAGATEGPANIRATGAIMENTQPAEFSASWAFILDELPGGKTRLIERFRVRFGETDKPWTRFTLPFMGFGVFVMMRKQLLGIKERAEATVGPVEVLA